MPGDKKDLRSRLLAEAAKAIAPLLGGCAGAMAGPPGAALGAAVGVALESKARKAVSYVAEKAFEYFAPGIVGRWLDWMRGKPRAEQLTAITELGTLSAEEARREAAAAIDELAPDANPADKDIALEYLAAIPSTAARSLVLDRSTGTLTVSQAISPDSRQSLLQLLPTTLPPYQAGTQLPGTTYRLDELLGTGGFGAVYRATDPTLQYLTFAIKFCLDPTLTDVLHQERKNLDRLMTAGKGDWSERLVRLYGYNLDHATPFLVYEHVAGGDLASALAVQRQATGRGFPPGQALGWIVQIIEALAFAHKGGLVHRDLKPANVLLSGPTIKLADFGIGAVAAAHVLEANRVGTVPGLPRTAAEQVSAYLGAGTPLYMSPEQRRGEPADPRQDLFSLGVLWYQLLVGDVTRELHPGWAAELAEEFNTPREHIDLIQRCVGWVKQRPAHAGELLTFLGQLHSPTSSPPPASAGGEQPRAASRPEGKDPRERVPSPAGPGNKEPDAIPVTGPFRKTLLLTRLTQLQRCHGEVGWASWNFPGRLVVFAGVFLAMAGGSGVGAMGYQVVHTFVGQPDKMWGGLPMVGIVLTGIMAGMALLYACIRFMRRIGRNREARAATQLQAKIEELVAEYPDEVRSWGGRAKLEDPDVAAQVLALVQREVLLG